MSKNNKYGPGYRSGRIRIAMARGNRALTCMRGLDMGAKRLESVVMVGTDDQNVKAISLDVIKDEEWSKKFHNYTLIWTRGKGVKFQIQHNYSIISVNKRKKQF